MLFSYHQTKKGWYENMKEKNKAGRVSKKTIATVLIAMIMRIAGVRIHTGRAVSWNRDVHEYCMELCSTRDCKGVVDLLCLI